MTRKFKNGQRVRITKGYGKPVGEIVKYSRTLDTYDVQGDDGYRYNCIPSSDIVLEDIKFEVELKPGEKLKSMIKQFEEAVHETEEVYLSRDQALLLLSEIKFLQIDNEQLQKQMDAVREAIKTQDYLDKEESEHPLLKRGDKLIRKSDGKVFTYACENSYGYVHVEEMCVAVKLSDFEKEEE